MSFYFCLEICRVLFNKTPTRKMFHFWLTVEQMWILILGLGVLAFFLTQIKIRAKKVVTDKANSENVTLPKRLRRFTANIINGS